jgi:hypothetical protein
MFTNSGNLFPKLAGAEQPIRDQPIAKVQYWEWVWIAGWSIGILILLSLPYLYGVYLSTPEKQFGGFVLGIEDGNSYLGKMRLGAGGVWSFHIFYTSEAHAGAYIFLFHLLLGKLARVSGLSLILVYHLARLFFGGFLLITVYYFTAFFTSLVPVRRLVFLLVALGSGLGWLILSLGAVERFGLPLDFYSPEAFSFHLLFGLPHLALAESLLLWSFLFVLVAWERQNFWFAIFAGLVLLGMTLIAAFYIIVAGAVIATALIGRSLQRWSTRSMSGAQLVRAGWNELKLATVALLFALPYCLYTAYIFSTNMVFRSWAEQNVIVSPSPLHYILAFGLLAVLAICGGWREWKSKSSLSSLLISWCLVVPILVFIPFNLQRRLTLGFQVPLSILAVLGGWWLLFERKNLITQPGSQGWRIVSLIFVALLSFSNLFILAGTFIQVHQQPPAIFHPGAEVAAAEWLGTQIAGDEVVLAAYETGNILPAYSQVRVFVGHGPETIRSGEKRELVRRFFTATTSEFWRKQLLFDYGIHYLYYGSRERSLGAFDPAEATYLEMIFDNGSVQLYRVQDIPEE